MDSYTQLQPRFGIYNKHNKKVQLQCNNKTEHTSNK